MTSAVQPPSDPAPAADRPAQDAAGGTPNQAPTEAPDWARDDAPPAQAPPAPEARDAAPQTPPAPAKAPTDPNAIAAARGAIQQTRTGGPESTGPDNRALADADAHPDDLDADNQGLAGTELLQRELGAQVIEEITPPVTPRPPRPEVTP